MIKTLGSTIVGRWGSARTLIWLSIIMPIGMLTISVMMLIDLRRDAWDRAEQTSQNLLQVIERDIARNVEIIDLSLRGLIDNLTGTNVREIDPAIRQLVLFDRAATARDMGVMLVLDEHGNTLYDSQALPARRNNYADRDYFQTHKLHRTTALHISRPIISRLSGDRIIVLSRRIDRADGTFGGVALATLRLTYFNQLVEQVKLGPDGAINLYQRDGTRLMRHPYNEVDIGVNIAGAPTFKRFVSERRGSFVAVSIRDGVERHFAFTQVGDLPLILNVALATAEIEADWRSKAYVIGSAVIILCSSTILLSVFLVRELARRARMQDDLAKLSRTDALTNLPNRRHFDEVIERCWKSACRTRQPLSLLIVDVDHFKRFNDRYGHAVGDAVLQGLARCLEASIRRPNDLACRLGGEEFAVILPDTNISGAQCIASEIHLQVSQLALSSSSIAAGSITVSIGIGFSKQVDVKAEFAGFFEIADQALYKAKLAGRNRTYCEGA
ncbi:MAG: sensor domain-containing diguanylate cyclase [Methylorubrum rhodinum]|uniref:sensor domain-containing diguanylate cyclase n=1 Tax=Methylorubrum rhodinum TaxID=29428 RepID=UPI003BAF855F